MDPNDQRSPFPTVTPTKQQMTSGPPTSTTPLQENSEQWIDQLTGEDRDLVMSPIGWLNDKVIDAVNNLVCLQIGVSAFNQSTLLAQTLVGFSAVDSETIQVVHDKNHWVATACINAVATQKKAEGGSSTSRKQIAFAWKYMYVHS